MNGIAHSDTWKGGTLEAQVGRELCTSESFFYNTARHAFESACRYEAAGGCRTGISWPARRVSPATVAGPWGLHRDGL